MCWRASTKPWSRSKVRTETPRAGGRGSHEVWRPEGTRVEVGCGVRDRGVAERHVPEHPPRRRIGIGAALAHPGRVGDGVDAEQRAVYYARVVERPTCRWSTRECNALAPAERPPTCDADGPPKLIRERAWTSPIWYAPPAE